MSRSRLYLFSIIAAAAMLVLVMSGAALTSSPFSSWRWLLTIHVAVAIAVALLSNGLVIALSRSTQPRLTRFRWVLLLALLVEVLLQFPADRATGPVAGTLHAVLAAFLVAALSAIALVTSRFWQRDPELVQDYGWPSLKSLSTAAAFLVAIQVGFGAGIRHSAVGVLPHLLGALLVAILIMIVGIFTTNQFPKHPTLRPIAVAFMVITGIQVFLGLTAFLMRMMNTTATTAWLAVSVGHVATGNLTFAASVLLAIEIRRNVRARMIAETQ
jgi:hypothetical protein